METNGKEGEVEFGRKETKGAVEAAERSPLSPLHPSIVQSTAAEHRDGGGAGGGALAAALLYCCSVLMAAALVAVGRRCVRWSWRGFSFQLHWSVAVCEAGRCEHINRGDTGGMMRNRAELGHETNTRTTRREEGTAAAAEGTRDTRKCR